MDRDETLIVFMLEKLNAMTIELTSFASFADMVFADPSQKIVLREARDPRCRVLADAYDIIQEGRGDARRAFRG